MSRPQALLSLDEARVRMLAAVEPLDAEDKALDASCLGRILAEDVIAAHDQPPFDSAAMDGYAVRRAEAALIATEFSLDAEVAAGMAAPALSPGGAIRIFTGAPMPEGADIVVPQELAKPLPEGRVVLGPLAKLSANYRRRGGDFSTGDLLVQHGLPLDPWRLSLLASAGRGMLRVARKPRVFVLTTGSELAPPGTVRGPQQIFESNGFAIAGLVRWWGGEAADKRSAIDDIPAITEAIGTSRADLIVTVGGASVGDYDLVKPALMALGLDLVFERIRMRPGKPTWFGRLGNGCPVLGLPGNPSAALVASQLLLKPLMLALQGADPGIHYEKALLIKDLRAGAGWERFERAALTVSNDARLQVQAFDDQDSGRVRVYAQAAALIRVPPDDNALMAGSLVDVVRLDRLGL